MNRRLWLLVHTLEYVERSALGSSRRVYKTSSNTLDSALDAERSSTQEQPDSGIVHAHET